MSTTVAIRQRALTSATKQLVLGRDLIAAAAGATVAKAGNRAATSSCGSADVLEALGVPIEPVDLVPALLARYRFAFLFSPAVHPVIGRLAPVRRRLGFRTLFNLTGP